MQKRTSFPVLLGLFLVCWLLLNLVQGTLLSLDPDEVYYWEYAQALDWGYFDHPPMVALLVRFGQWLGGSVGVRLGVILLHVGTIFLFWKYLGAPTSRERLFTWMALVAALPFMHVYGFIATPDSPLLFFSIAYLYVFERFVKKPSWATALLLGMLMAALLYSKYHGLLIILCTVLANIKLFKRLDFWVAGIFGVLLFLPHLYWQYAHDFPSFRYHLTGRDDPYQVKYTLEYLVNQVLIFSPLLFPFYIWAMRAPAALRTELTLVLGFWGFFLWTTFKGHVEPQWTAILSFPLARLAFDYSATMPRVAKNLTRVAWASTGIIVILRLVLFFLPPSVKTPFREKSWPMEVAAFAQGRPVVFQNSYRDVSEYEFYTGKNAYTWTDVYYRPNQFDIWTRETAIQNASVLFVLQMDTLQYPGCDTIEWTNKRRRILWADSLQVVQKVRIAAAAFPRVLRSTRTFELSLTATNPYPFSIYPDKGTLPVGIQVVFMQAGQVVHRTALTSTKYPTAWPSRKTVALKGLLNAPALPPGEYEAVLGLSNGSLPPGWNSPAYTVRIEK